MVAAIAEVEAEVADLDTSAWRWTLTWLEGRPVVELDDGTTLRYDPATDSVSRDRVGQPTSRMNARELVGHVAAAPRTP